MAKVLFINPMVREEDDPKHVPMGMAQLAAIITVSYTHLTLPTKA